MKGPAAESACGFAAINPHNLAGDEGRSLGGEKDDGVSDLVWLGAAFERHRGIERRILVERGGLAIVWLVGQCLSDLAREKCSGSFLLSHSFTWVL